MLVTKFNPRLYVSSTVIPPIPSGPNAFSKGTREAALRERGLLPPLKSNKDLSAQEKEQDRAIPILLSRDDLHTSAEAEAYSAAALIKKEWEAKNRSLEPTQLRKMNSFKFGGASSTPDSPVLPTEFSTESADLMVPDIPTREPLPFPPSTVPISTPDSRPVTPLLEITPEIAAFLYPLAPSPVSLSTPKFELSSRPPSPTSVPLPRSPSSRSAFDTASLGSASGERTPGPLDFRTSSTPPVIALTPCVASFPDLAVLADDITSSLQKRTDLFAALDEEASSSAQTPSLDSNSESHTTTTDSRTSESVEISGKGRLNGLKIKTHEGSNIPIIVESPIEDSFLEERYVVPESSCTTFDGPPTAPVSGNEPRVSVNTPRITRRGHTDPTNGNLDRKKSMIMNPFKLGTSSSHEDHSTTPSGERQRRLSLRASLSNMRRSVVGTLSRKPILAENSGRGKMFDASHLPPSPTLRSPTAPGFVTEDGESSARRGVSPIVYSRGHILMETNRIEDEESRRMTEMAFLT